MTGPRFGGPPGMRGWGKGKMNLKFLRDVSGFECPRQSILQGACAHLSKR
jgi:hypothetical protein